MISMCAGSAIRVNCYGSFQNRINNLCPLRTVPINRCQIPSLRRLKLHFGTHVFASFPEDFVGCIIAVFWRLMFTEERLESLHDVALEEHLDHALEIIGRT